MISTDSKLDLGVYVGPGNGFGWNQPMNSHLMYSKEQGSAFRLLTPSQADRLLTMPSKRFTLDTQPIKDEYTPIYEACTE
jgi:hypothetical protein